MSQPTICRTCGAQFVPIEHEHTCFQCAAPALADAVISDLTQTPRNSPIERLQQFSQGSKARLAQSFCAYLMHLEQLNRENLGVNQNLTSALHSFMDMEDAFIRELITPQTPELK